MRQRLVVEDRDGSRIDMIADSYFVQLLRDYENAVRLGDGFIDSVCEGLGRHPRYVHAFENMLDREDNPERRKIIERILLEYEFLSAFRLMDNEEEGY